MDREKLPVYTAPLVVFFVIFGVVLFSFFQLRTNLNDEISDRFTVTRNGTEDEVVTKLNTAEIALNSVVGFINSSTYVDSDEWQTFARDSSVLENLDGVQSLGYVKVGNVDELSDYFSDDVRHAPQFELRTVGDEYGVIARIAPETEQNLAYLGLNIYTDEHRFEAIERVRDLGITQLTRVIDILLAEGSTGSGVVMYTPQYKKGLEKIPENIDGYVYASIEINEFISRTLGERDFDRVGLQVFSDDERTLFESESFSEITSSGHEVVEDEINIKGQAWTFRFVYDEELLVGEDEVRRPMLILVLGSLVAVLVAGVTYLLIQLKEDEIALSREKEVNKAKDSLLSIASHQLRTPATGVKQYIGMLHQGFVGGLTDQQMAILDKAYSSNERQLKTINDILFLARMESGRVVITKNDTDLSKLVRSIVDEQQSEIQKSNHGVKVHMPKRKIIAHVDEHMFRMAIENLLSNAIKYTPNGGSIELRLASTREDIKIAVSDSGVGLSDEDKKNLYKQFVRFDNKLSKSVSGTGIGLYLVKQIAEMHGARISVESEQGSGTTFTLTLPLEK